MTAWCTSGSVKDNMGPDSVGSSIGSEGISGATIVAWSKSYDCVFELAAVAPGADLPV